MADQLVTPQELASFLQLTYANLTAAQQATMAMLAELATGKVQAGAAGQRLVDATSTAVIDVEMCYQDLYLPLPQRPVRSVTTVKIDGVTTTDVLLRKQQLWRSGGWNTNSSQPTQVTATTVHGYVAGAQGLQLARDMAFGLGAAGWGRPDATVKSERIDDYQVTYAEADSRMQVTDSMRDQLLAKYANTAYVTLSRD
jgi:hypothetical protein